MLGVYEVKRPDGTLLYQTAYSCHMNSGLFVPALVPPYTITRTEAGRVMARIEVAADGSKRIIIPHDGRLDAASFDLPPGAEIESITVMSKPYDVKPADIGSAVLLRPGIEYVPASFPNPTLADKGLLVTATGSIFVTVLPAPCKQFEWKTVSVDELLLSHWMDLLGHAACGADEPNQGITEVRENITCKLCAGLERAERLKVMVAEGAKLVAEAERLEALGESNRRNGTPAAPVRFREFL